MAEPADTRGDILDRLAASIAARRTADPATSYVAALLAKATTRAEEDRRGGHRDGHGGEGR